MILFGIIEIRLKTVKNQCIDLLRQGERIKAIKLYRSKTRASLKDAMDYTASLQTQYGIFPPKQEATHGTTT